MTTTCACQRTILRTQQELWIRLRLLRNSNIFPALSGEPCEALSYRLDQVLQYPHVDNPMLGSPVF